MMNKEKELYTGICFINDIRNVTFEQTVIAREKVGGELLQNNFFTVSSSGRVESLFKMLRDDVDFQNIFSIISRDGESKVYALYYYDVVSGKYVENADNIDTLATVNDIEFLEKYSTRKINTRLFSMFKWAYKNNWVQNMHGSGLMGIDLSRVKDILFNNFYVKWNNLLQTIITEYDYLKPFSIALDETSSDDLTTTEDSTEYTDNDQSFTFNNPEPVDTDKATGNSNRRYSRTNPRTRNYTRVGNIGNQSFADLTIKEREKAIFNFKEIIFEDIASVLLYDTYND